MSGFEIGGVGNVYDRYYSAIRNNIAWRGQTNGENRPTIDLPDGEKLKPANPNTKYGINLPNVQTHTKYGINCSLPDEVVISTKYGINCPPPSSYMKYGINVPHPSASTKYGINYPPTNK